MKKKVLAMLLAGAMVVGSLVGCGGGGSDAASSDDAAAAEDGGSEAAEGESTGGAGDMGKISLIIGLRDEFRAVLESGTLKAAEELGINIVTQDAQNDVSKQIQFVELARNEGQKAIIVNMVDTATAAQIIEAAGDMKVVFINMPPNDLSVLNENVAYVGSDETQAGGFQGEFLANYFKEQGKTDIKYILLSGTLGATYTVQRTESALKGMEDNGLNATEATSPLVADYERATAMDLFAPLVSTTEYDCIIANNDAMALGAIEALVQAGKDPADTPVVGIDATVDGCNAIKDGSLAMTVFQDGEGQGYGALMAAYNMVMGNELGADSGFETDESGYILWVPFEPVTAENVDDYIK